MKLNSIAASVVGLLVCWQIASAEDVVWQKMPGSGLHMASNRTALPWLVSLDRIAEAGYSIRSFNNVNWTQQPGVGYRIAMDGSGRPWVVNEQKRIYRFDAGAGSWQAMPGEGNDIAAGGDGSVWIISNTKTAGGYSVQRWNNTTQNWVLMTGGGVRIAVETDGSPWLANDGGSIFRYNLASNTWSQKNGFSKSVDNVDATRRQLTTCGSSWSGVSIAFDRTSARSPRSNFQRCVPLAQSRSIRVAFDCCRRIKLMG